MNWEQSGTFASHFLLWMAGIQVRGLALLTLIAIIVFFLRRSSAALRHLTLSLAFLSLLALPLISLSVPTWIVPPLPSIKVSLPRVAHRAIDTVPGERRSGAAPTFASPASQPLAPTYQGAVAGSNGGTNVGLSSLSPFVPITATVVFIVWMLGTLLLLLRLVIGLIRLQKLAKRAEPATNAAPVLAEELSALSLSLPLGTSVRLLVGTSEMAGLSPMTWGLWRPVVLLPAESNRWSLSCLRPVLLHELAHVERGDWATEFLSRVVCALYWPNPLVWLLLRRLQSESEAAADDRVLLAGIAPTDYAQQLVAVARQLARREQLLVPSAAVMMAHNSQVKDRVRAILSGQHSRKPATARSVALALVGMTILLLPLAKLRIASAGDEEKRQQAQAKSQMTPEEYRAIVTTRFAPGSDPFPNGVVAEGFYVSGLQSDGSLAAWDRKGNLLAHIPNGRGSRLKDGELRFQIHRLKLPGTDEWLDKATFDRLVKTRAIESEFGVVGSPAGYFGQPGATEYGNGYRNFTESYVWKPQRAAEKVDAYLTTSYGPWKTLTPNAYSGIALRRNLAEAECGVALPGRFLERDANGRPLWRLRLELVDAEGNIAGNPRIAQYNETPKGSPYAFLRFRFLTSELPLSKVRSVRLMARPLQTIYFRNIPTRPKGLPRTPTESQ